MNNYPPGMTREDWKHIDGPSHYRGCPQHEDSDGIPDKAIRGCWCNEIAQQIIDDAAERKAEERRFHDYDA